MLKYHHVMNCWMEHLLGDRPKEQDTIIDGQWKKMNYTNDDEFAKQIQEYQLVFALFSDQLLFASRFEGNYESIEQNPEESD